MLKGRVVSATSAMFSSILFKRMPNWHGTEVTERETYKYLTNNIINFSQLSVNSFNRSND